MRVMRLDSQPPVSEWKNSCHLVSCSKKYMTVGESYKIDKARFYETKYLLSFDTLLAGISNDLSLKFW